jgi:hypothetical protein
MIHLIASIGRKGLEKVANRKPYNPSERERVEMSLSG